MQMIVDVRCPECDEVLGPDIEYSPGRPAYPTSNPDHPEYGNPPDPGYFDGCPDHCPKCGEHIDEEWARRQAEDLFRDAAEAAAEDAAEARYEDWKDRNT